MFHNLTPKAQQVLVLAKKLVLKFQQKYLSTDHLLLSLLELRQGIAARVLQHMGLDIETVHDTLERHIATGKGEAEGWVPSEQNSTDIPLTPRAREVLKLAEKKSKEFRHTYIGTEHILLGLLEEGRGLGARLLQTLDVDFAECKREILAEMNPEGDSDDIDDNDDDDDIFDDDNGFYGNEEPDNEMFFQSNAGNINIVKNFGQNLTAKAQNNELDPVIGRDKEIERLIQILCRRTKNNPVLIGEAGVGKTAVVEGLAQRIANGQVPDLLQNKAIINLDLALLLSGTKYRGQFEERLKRLMDEVKSSDNILFLDELHTIVGAGSAEGSMDASNILKPALARGEFQCIGATTLDEYRKSIEKDMALNRRFQAVLVEQPSPEDTLKILEGLKPRYEAFHNVHYSEAILKESVGLTRRYVPSRVFPDKAIDLLDEAGARTKLLITHAAPSTESVDRAIRAVKTKKMKAINEQDFEAAARWRDEEQSLKADRLEIIDLWKQKNKSKRTPVKEETLQRVVFDWTGIPVEKMGANELQHYLNLDKVLNKTVIGQEEAVSAITRTLKRSRVDLKDPNHPIGSFLFLGPTGVGKTYLVKILAEQIFGNRDAIVQIDMSEYMEKHTVARLIGSPPGYVGHEDGGMLTEAVRRKPYSVVLFDEIEKAHPDVIQILLQVLEEGHLTDALGRRVDFKNTIIVMTSNVGAQALQKGSGLGFSVASPVFAFEQLKNSVQEAMKSAFQPEFLNRIGEVVIFKPLTRENMLSIVDIELDKVRERLEKKSVKLVVEPEVKTFLLEKGFDEKLGARPLKRAVERYVEDCLVDGLLEQNIKAHQTVVLKLDRDKKSVGYRVVRLKSRKKAVDVK